eukprot:359747-Pleurochrysis_carterae.AAC.2
MAACPLEAICTEISILPPGAPAVLAHTQPSGYRVLRRFRTFRVKRAASMFVRPEKCAPTNSRNDFAHSDCQYRLYLRPYSYRKPNPLTGPGVRYP